MALGGSSGQQQIDILLRIMASTTGATQASQALAQLQKQGDRLGANLHRAFSPRATQNIQQIRAQLLGQGQALEQLGVKLATVDPKLTKTAKEMRELGLAQQQMGVTGKISNAEMLNQSTTLSKLSGSVRSYRRELEKQLVANQASIASAQNVVTGGSSKAQAAKDATLRPLLEQNQAIQEGIRLNKQWTAELARASGAQGLLAQQTEKAMLSLGAMGGEATFAGKAGQGLVLSFSMAQLAAGNLSAGLFGLGFSLMFVGRSMLGWPLVIATATTALTLGLPALAKWVKGLGDTETQQERVQKTLDGFSDALKAVKGPIVELADEQERLAASGEPVIAAITQQMLKLAALQALKERLTKGRFDGITDAFRGVASGLPLISKASEAENVLTDAFNDQIAVLNTNMSALMAREAALRSSIAAEARHEKVMSTINGVFDRASKSTRNYYDNLIDGARKSGQAVIDGIQKTLQGDIRGIQKALEAQRKLIQQGAEDRIEIARDESDVAIKASKDRVDAIKEQERELVNEFNRLQSERIRTINDIKTTEAEIVALKHLIRQFGPDESLQGDLAIREARLQALQEISGELQDQAATNEEQQDGLKDQIDIEEELQDTIKDDLQERIDLINEEKDTAIEAANDAAEASQDAARETADIQIAESRRATDEQVKHLEEQRDKAQEVLDKFRDKVTSMFEATGKQKELNDLVARERDLQAEIALMTELRTKSLSEQQRILLALNTARQAVRQLQSVGTKPTTIRDVIKGYLHGQGVSDDIIRILLAELGIPQFARGGTMPGARGQPGLAMLHGGETVLPAETGKGTGNIILYIQIEHVDVNQPSDLAKIAAAVNRSLGKETSLSLRSRRFSGR